jgi:anti-sigma-K factor RskA
MTCKGFTAVTYDLYVLGLLDEEERDGISAHIRDQCPECVQGVQHSMNLWIVFATTLQNAEPSAGFKTRLTQIAELSKRVLTFPKGPVTMDRTRTLKWMLIGLGCVLASMLTLAGWRAGRAAASIDQQRLTTEVTDLTQKIASLEVDVQRESSERKRAESLLSESSSRHTADELANLRSDLLKSQAAANQYKSLLDRGQQFTAENKDLLTAFSVAGTHLYPLKTGEKSSSTTAYVLTIPGSGLIFVGFDLPKLTPDRQYQLWVSRKPDSKLGSVGLFSPDSGGDAFVQIDDPSIGSELSAIAVTDEPRGGSSTPTGSILYVEGSVPADSHGTSP